MSKEINTKAALHAALADVFAKTDFNLIGDIKDHMEPKYTMAVDPKDKSKEIKVPTGEKDAEGREIKVPTGELYFTTQLRMPQGSALNIDGTDLYPNTLQVKIDGFKLSTTPGERPATGDGAATTNADKLSMKLKGFTPKVVAVPAAAPAAQAPPPVS